MQLEVKIQGTVQGVGFRPFVYRLATELGLRGWVKNSSQGLLIGVEAEKEILERFLARIQNEKPLHATIRSLEYAFKISEASYDSFQIMPSMDHGVKTALVLPDIATCVDCLSEICDPQNRRFRYPFTNCTNCGPRFTIIEHLPYDRVNTSMKSFPMCKECFLEYRDPTNRRFHAEPNACPSCGPGLQLWNDNGEILSWNFSALLAAAKAIREGQILAVKGLGGFHLMVDARNENAVKCLRKRKQRERKPLALLFPSLEQIKKEAYVSSLEEKLLTSAESPIVLLERFSDRGEIAPSVAPDNPILGIMLPYTPLHCLLMTELGFPVVATSGNLSDEPICIDEEEALKRLQGIADLFLVHDRRIARHADDSIARVIADRPMLIRRARGYAPFPVQLSQAVPTFLAVGGHQKNTIAVSVGQDVFLSQHIGDLETNEAFKSFSSTIQDFSQFYDVHPVAVVCDAHPGYFSTHYAQQSAKPVIKIQHHMAHVASCIAENQLEGPLLGIAWDGTGYGLDGTIWGGEFFRVIDASFTRVGHLRTFQLSGGEKAVKEPRRSALGLLYEFFGERVFAQKELPTLQAFSLQELEVLRGMLQKKINSPRTSSMGRLFDAVASILGLIQKSSFDGEAPMALEFAAGKKDCFDSYPFNINKNQNGDWPLMIDWFPMIEMILCDFSNRKAVSEISKKFHNTLAEMILQTAYRIGERCVVLSGGCFQNKILTEETIRRLKKNGFSPYWHQNVSPNDGGIALGQVAAASRLLLQGG